MFEIVMGIDDFLIQLVKYWNYQFVPDPGFDKCNNPRSCYAFCSYLSLFYYISCLWVYKVSYGCFHFPVKNVTTKVLPFKFHIADSVWRSNGPIFNFLTFQSRPGNS